MPRTRTTFKPGQVTNPKGRPREFPEFREACRQRSPQALAMMDAALAEGPSPLALEAAKVLLSYAWGRPPQTLTGEGGEGAAQLVINILKGHAQD